MAPPRLFTPEHIAPCGANCGLCSSYLAFTHEIPKKRGKISHCSGCRTRNKQCGYLKGQCPPLAKGAITFCYECRNYPCSHLQNLDRRYRTMYGVSFIGNLEEIRDAGLKVFLAHQSRSFLCQKCRQDVICVHNKKCYYCDRVTSWRSSTVRPRV